MKFTKLTIKPKNIFRSKRSRSRSLSGSDDPMSFSSGTTLSDSSESSSSFKHKSSGRNGSATPTSVLASHLSGDDLYIELLHAFKLMDSDGDGKITREELKGLLTPVVNGTPIQEEMMLLLGDLDEDGDGYVSLREFKIIISALTYPAGDAELRETFDYFDTDRDGRITAEELFRGLSTLGNEQCTLEECQRMIKGVNKNGEGFVCFEDFSRMMELQ